MRYLLVFLILCWSCLAFAAQTDPQGTENSTETTQEKTTQETPPADSKLDVMPAIIKATLPPAGGSYTAVIYIVDRTGQSVDFTWQLSPDRVWIKPKEVSGKGPAAVEVEITSENPKETVGSISVYSDIGSTFITVRRSFKEEEEEENREVILSPSSIKVNVVRLPGQETSKEITLGLSCVNFGNWIETVWESRDEYKSEDNKSTYTSQTTQKPTVINQECAVSTNQPWIIVESLALCDSRIPITLQFSPEDEEGYYEGEVTVSCEGIRATSRIEVFLDEQAKDQLVLSPSFLDLTFTKADLLPRVFSVRLYNANQEGRGFHWKAQSLSPWIKVSPQEGYSKKASGQTVSLTLDPIGLPAGSYQGIVKFYSDLDEKSATEGTDLQINLDLKPWQTLEVFPSYLFWSLESGEGGILSAPQPQRLHIYAGAAGWSVATDVPWIELSSLWPALVTQEETNPGEEAGAQTVVTPPEGYIQVSLVASELSGLPFGRYEGHVRVTDRASGLYRDVPVVVEIREQGAPVELPVLPPEFSQLTPEFVRVEATDGSWLELRLPALGPVPETEEDCKAFGGRWEEGRCLFSSRIFLTMASPELWPDVVWAWRPTEGHFEIIEKAGVPVPGADDLYVSLGPLSDITFGPAQLLGLSGEVFFEVKVGERYSSARTLQRVELQIYTPEGPWEVTDYFEGEAYRHPDLLVFTRKGAGWEACWELNDQCLVPVKVTYGDGKTFLYQLEFSEGGYWFEYQVKELRPGEMKGKWRFFDGERWSAWESFLGARGEGHSVFPKPFPLPTR